METDFGYEDMDPRSADFLTSVTHGEIDKLPSPLRPFSPAGVLDFAGDPLEFLEVQDSAISPGFGQQKSDTLTTDHSPASSGLGCIPADTRAPQTQNGITLGVQAFQDSLWSFNPTQKHLWKSQVTQLSGTHQKTDEISKRKSTSCSPLPILVTSSTRNEIMSLILSLLDHKSTEETRSILSSFPSTDLLTCLINQFFKDHMKEPDAFIHVPTFDPQEQIPELLVAMITSAAMSSPHGQVRDFGSLLHDAHQELNGRMVWRHMLSDFSDVLNGLSTAMITETIDSSHRFSRLLCT